MIAYTVTCLFESPALADEFAAWLAREHLADVLAAGALDGEIVRLDGDPPACEARYHFASRDAHAIYMREHAPRLRAETLEMFPEGVTFRRSVGDVIDDPMAVTAPWHAMEDKVP